MTTSPTTDLRPLLRQRLKEAMVERDRAATEVLRIAIAAVDNAEAQPLDSTTASAPAAIEDAPASAEVRRREVDGDEARAILAAELDELTAAAAHYAELGQADAADRAHHQASVLAEVLASIDRRPPTRR